LPVFLFIISFLFIGSGVWQSLTARSDLMTTNALLAFVVGFVCFAGAGILDAVRRLPGHPDDPTAKKHPPKPT
jgi:hypothetical protein